MLLLRARRRFLAWLTMLAMAVGALAPALAQAVAASADDARWVELCTASGMVWMKADADAAVGLADTSTLPAGEQAAPACPWCLLHGGAAGLPPAPVAIDLPERLAHHLPPAFYRAPSPSFAWAPQRSRAPPAIA